ncbi:LysR family substrate-binding domain-containing protein [Nocardia transvalensis]|uniref:LysR family substrate-binding domain-containing protein n=1 Tax=Nocardia transvalensis TaxID=37333 RepID=UPI0018945E51|nr:LysR family substrate-binding domain-containing protein [Nocardia transvalensis]MBF6328166.1 LysR family substrate-binding domain-containing protein [Nocardia transvalensis]
MDAWSFRAIMVAMEPRAEFSNIYPEVTTPRSVFAQRLTALFEVAGNPTMTVVSRAAEDRMKAARGHRPRYRATVQRISDWRRGYSVPARFDTLLPVLMTLIQLTKRSGAPVAPELVDLQEWQRVWRLADPRRSSANHRGAATMARKMIIPDVDRNNGTATERQFRVGTLGPCTAELMGLALETFSRDHPGTEVRLVPGDFTDPTAGLLHDRVDVALCWAPFSMAGLDATIVFEDQCYVVVPADDPLATAPQVTMADLSQKIGVRVYACADPYWQNFWHVGKDGPEVRSMGELLYAVRWGEAISLVPATLADRNRIEGVTYRTITDSPPCRSVLAWRRSNASPLIPTFVSVLRQWANTLTAVSVSGD